MREELNIYMQQKIKMLDAHDRIKKAMEYSLISNGKLIRPLVFLLFIKERNVDYKKFFNVAMAIEMIHVYSLIHDDLPAMDNDDYRRGRLTCHKKFTEDIAILAGDALLTLAFELISETDIDPKLVVKMVYYTAKHSGVNDGMINGQVLDILSTSDIDVDGLKQIHIQKTARLLQLPFILGILVCDEEDLIDNALNVAEAIGLAYQIQDDYLDRYGDESLLGKPVGSDAINNKKTYVDIYTKHEIESMLREFSVAIEKGLNTIKVGEKLQELIASLEKREF